MNDLQHKKIALLGFGVENRAMLPYVLEQGAQVTVLDKNEELTDLPAGVASVLGPDYMESLTDYDIVFRSPGIPYLSKQIQAAKQAGVTITSQTKYFLEQCPAPVIGVTGTKGKGTTSSLIKTILDAARKAGEVPGNVYLAGNIGQPPIGLLKMVTEKDWVILELSSFQLQDVTTSPDIAVVLNITVDHLDHHRDEAEYISAKKNIARYQTPGDSLVINLDSLTSMLFADESPAQAYFFSRVKSVDQGAFVERRLGDDVVMLRLPGQPDREVCKIADVKLVGAYNLENVTAAVTAAALAGATVDSIRTGVTSFTGLPHRLQLVGEANGVSYYDDSKSTTPDSTVAAIMAFDRPITLIVGGSSKGADFTELVETIPGSTVENIICIGQEGERLMELFMDTGLSQTVVQGGSTMRKIVELAASMASPDSVVLLSPAAASFDMFANAEDRGNQFQAAVHTLRS